MPATEGTGNNKGLKSREEIIRRPHRAPVTVKTGPRANEEILVPTVRLIDADGDNAGVVTTAEAIQRAYDAQLDLVEISPNADPPVCKIMDFGKFKYIAQKKRNEDRKKQKTVEVKELKFRPNINDHDYEVKMRAMAKFLEEGDKVKITLRFRGREIAHQEIGLELLTRVRDDVADTAKVEQEPNMEGRQMVMLLTPR